MLGFSSSMATTQTLIWFLVFCSNLFNHNVVEASHKIFSHLQSMQVENVGDVQRTGYHFQPPRNWINDPNAPMFYKGYYHLFYQYNPKGAVWGNIVWAHSVSKDLINWLPLEPAIYPSKPFDINGCWSGSATILPGNKPAILYTGIDSQNRQVQNIAFPKNLSDPFLKEWVKPDYNPIMEPTAENEINNSKFRDPTTAWYNNGHWKLVVGNRRGEARGMALLYRSKDFIKWTKAKHPLHSAPKTGMWECVDFFPVLRHGRQGLDLSSLGNHVKHVLKASLDNTRFEYYTIGTYFPEKDKYVPDGNSADDSTGLRYDYGNFYASKTFFDEKNNRRILWGWSNESDTKDNDVAKGWAGIQLIPRTLWLDKYGERLMQWPIKEIESLRGGNFHLENAKLVKGERLEVQGIDVEQADVEVKFHVSSLKNAETFDPSWVDAETICGQKNASVEGGIGPFGLLTLASDNLEEYTAVFFHIFKSKDKHVVLMCSGGERSSLRKELYKPSYGGFVDVDLQKGTLPLRTLIDHSVVESFGLGGKISISSRVYPSLALRKKAHLYLFNNGRETIKMRRLNAWSMKSARMNT